MINGINFTGRDVYAKQGIQQTKDRFVGEATVFPKRVRKRMQKRQDKLAKKVEIQRANAQKTEVYFNPFAPAGTISDKPTVFVAETMPHALEVMA